MVLCHGPAWLSGTSPFGEASHTRCETQVKQDPTPKEPSMAVGLANGTGALNIGQGLGFLQG